MEKDIAIELYKIFKGESTESFRFHQQVLQRYVAFTVAILGASIAGFYKMQGYGPLGCVLLIGPLINIGVCVLGRATCKSFYEAALKDISIIRKIEYILGIEDYPTIKRENVEKPFKDDKYLFPVDRVRQKKINDEYTKNYDTTEDFTDAKIDSGVNRHARWTFIFIGSINVVLAMAIIIMAL
jgi:hypothetical protein